MDNIIELATQIIICLVIAALIGAIIGYLLGKMSKCDNKEDIEDFETKKELNDYSAPNKDTIEATKGKSTEEIAKVAGTSTAATMHIQDKDLTAAIGQEVGVRPVQLSDTHDKEIDDLKEISGIGLKVEEVLHSIGIYRFEQIANWNSDNIEWVENYLSFKGRIKKEDWIAQAKLLSAGSQTEFSKRVRRGENPNY